MPRYDRLVIDSIKSRLPISQLVSRFMPVVTKNNKKWVVCPFHNDKNPSMILDDERRSYFCFGCGARGSVFDFLEEYEHISFSEAVARLAAECGVPLEEESPETLKRRKEIDSVAEIYKVLASDFMYCLDSSKGKKAVSYLEGRHINYVLRKDFLIGYAPDDRNYIRDFLNKKGFSDEIIDKAGLFSKESHYPYFVDRIVLPIQNDRGKIVAFSARTMKKSSNVPKYINSSETDIFKKGENFYAFAQSLPSLRKSVPPVICEGNFDAIAMHASGVTTAIATCGTALTERHAAILRRFSDKANLFFDSDDAGVKATKLAVVRLAAAGVSARVVLLEKYKDACEAYENEGEGYLKSVVANSVPAIEFLLKKSLEKSDTSSLSYKDGVIKEFAEFHNALNSGIEKLELVRFLSERLSVPENFVREAFASDADLVASVSHATPVRRVHEEKGPFYETDLVKLLLIRRNFFYDDLLCGIHMQDFRNRKARMIFRLIAECSDEALVSDDIFIGEIENEEEKKFVKDVFYKYAPEYKSYSDSRVREEIDQSAFRIKEAKLRFDIEKLNAFAQVFPSSDELVQKRAEIVSKSRLKV